MLTIINIKEEPYKNFAERVKAVWKHKENPVSVINNIDDVYVHNINFIKRNKRIPWKRIESLVGRCNSNILCNKELEFPKNVSLRRFEPESFKEEICLLFSLEILKQLKDFAKELRVVFYDPLGEYSSFLYELVEFTSQVTVITDNKYHYEDESSRIMDEFGANVFINKSLCSRKYFDLVIAPHKIERNLNTQRLSVILTSRPYVYPVKGIIYDKYKYTPNIDFKSFFSYPLDISNEYIAGALYELENKEDILNIIPVSAKTWFEQENTVSEILELIKKSIEKQNNTK